MGAFLRNGIPGLFAAALRVACPRALVPATYLAAGLRDLGFAGDLRTGFAGFLAMIILEKPMPDASHVGAIGKTSNYIILSIGQSPNPTVCLPAEVRAIMATQLGRAGRLAAADDVFDNSGPPEAIGPAVAELDRRYRQMAHSPTH